MQTSRSLGVYLISKQAGRCGLFIPHVLTDCFFVLIIMRRLLTVSHYLAVREYYLRWPVDLIHLGPKRQIIPVLLMHVVPSMCKGRMIVQSSDSCSSFFQ